ncbi:hypothetical protein HS041_12065 [Planomonospora sp. ID67723]|uniref:hypothetical protein n=1 Tax=Planomonospora sp. ID67723 TaxID=2738134 RepID=UPI0018C43F6F|nr:hypothetical protein [Planomonospora sp. ID67723]MBG0828503.1 hypothetical protein [Planomonospora sp. ID67723]
MNTQSMPAVDQPRLSYSPDVVSRMQALVRAEVDNVRKTAQERIATLRAEEQRTQEWMKRTITEFEQAMGDILGQAEPRPSAFEAAPDLAADPMKNLAALESLHNAQNAREGGAR